jgi:3-hydroxybutyryl-CoA dehydrogenase
MEKLEVKQDLFAEMEAHCSPITILSTNTSVLSVTEIAAKCNGKERVVGTHFWDPHYLIPLVEVIKGRDTSDAVIDYTCQLLRSAGKRPVKVKQDVPGFIGNRLQHALWREAISIVERGIAEPEMVDEVIRSGFALRLPVLGPLQHADMVGLDQILRIHDCIFPHIEKSSEPSALLRQKQIAGELGFKTGKGFYKWDRESMQECRKRLIEHLIRRKREDEGESGEAKRIEKQ